MDQKNFKRLVEKFEFSIKEEIAPLLLVTKSEEGISDLKKRYEELTNALMANYISCALMRARLCSSQEECSSFLEATSINSNRMVEKITEALNKNQEGSLA